LKAAVLYNINDLRYEEVKKPIIKNNEALIKVKAAGICNSDVPRVKTHGAYHYPIILGHEFCGIVEDIKCNNTNLQKNDKVTVFPLIPCKKCIYCERGEYAQCENYSYLGSRTNGGFAEYVKVPIWNLIKLPNNISFEEGACIEPMAVALHAVRRFSQDIWEHVCIFGAGTIGLGVAQILNIYGAKNIFLVDILPEKLKFAKKYFKFIYPINAKNLNPITEIKKFTNNLGVDLCIECAGVPQTFNQSIHITQKFGKIILLGNQHSDVTLPYNTFSLILRKQLHITGSWNSTFSEFPKNEWKVIIDLISSKKLNVKNLITHKFHLKECNKVFNMMYEKKEFFNKVLFIF